MKKLFKILGGALVLLVGLGILFVGWTQIRGIPTYATPAVAPRPRPTSPDALATGEKLVVTTCAECHLNRQTNTLAGQLVRDVPPDFGVVYSANITQDAKHGIGRWTDAQLEALLRTGIGRDGRYRLVMPHFVHTSDDDISSILAFLRSDHPWVKATPTPTPAQEPSALLKLLVNTVMKPTPLLPPRPWSTAATW